MAKKSKLTTKSFYKNGYTAAQEGKPRRSPHRTGTTSEEIWFVGFDAFMDGGTPPEEPRKKRTKAEMEQDRLDPPTKAPLPTSLKIAPKSPIRVPRARGDGLLEHLFAAQKAVKTETDPEMLELCHMELADLEWSVYVEDGDKPSTRWDEYKTERGLSFDRKVA